MYLKYKFNYICKSRSFHIYTLHPKTHQPKNKVKYIVIEFLSRSE